MFGFFGDIMDPENFSVIVISPDDFSIDPGKGYKVLDKSNVFFWHAILFFTHVKYLFKMDLVSFLPLPNFLYKLSFPFLSDE